MCYGCYEEAGRPAIITPTTQGMAELIQRLYDMPDGCVGGHAHIVLDDWNLEDGDIDYCLEVAKENKHGYDPEQVSLEITILTHLKRMTEDERYSSLALVDGFIKAE
jgi:hypothetical protein